MKHNMKNRIYYILAIFLCVSLYSCKEDDPVESEYSVDREFMAMFRHIENTGKDGTDDPYRCQVVNLNDIHLYWYGVKGCGGYEIKMALMPNVSSGLAEDWDNPNHILYHEIVGPDVTDIVIKDLQYNTDYRFAIRTLSLKGTGINDPSNPHHSKWYGYGGGRQWADYMGLKTEERYNVPEVIVVNGVTKNTLRVNLDRNYATSGDDGTFLNHFEVDGSGNFEMQTMLIEVSPTNPNATMPEVWKNYTLTQADFDRGYIDVDGLQENSVYLINVKNNNIPVHWDAIYNTCVIRMDGEPGEPIFIEHYCDPNDTIPGATKYNASRLDVILDNYNADATLAEGTIFELEAGKTYYLATNVSLCKGLTLRTKDYVEGVTPRAKVLLNGMSTINGAAQACNFMFGRPPQSGELGGINIKSLIFEDIDFDCPEATFYTASAGSNGTGNYFINMYSNGMPVTLQSFEVRNCTFQRMVRGFVRVQGSGRKNFEHFIVENCLFYNCGNYQSTGGGYPWVAGDSSTPKTNIFNDMVFRNNTFYDSPRASFFSSNNYDAAWPSNVKFNITLENNTFVNFSTRSASALFALRFMPTGSKYTIRKNLFIQTKKDGDARAMNLVGANDLRGINGLPALVELNIEQNYSTNTNLTNGQIFTAGAFSATSRGFGQWWESNTPSRAEMETHLGSDGGISPTELMADPNPPYPSPHDKMHLRDNLDGLYYNNTPKVRNHEIYKLGIGDPRWRKNVTP